MRLLQLKRRRITLYSDWQPIPRTCRSKSRSVMPASFLATHVYLPASVSRELTISSCWPLASTRNRASVWSIGSPLLIHSTSGVGMPDTEHWIVAVLPTTTCGDEVLLVVTLILGGTNTHTHTHTHTHTRTHTRTHTYVHGLPG